MSTKSVKNSLIMSSGFWCPVSKVIEAKSGSGCRFRSGTIIDVSGDESEFGDDDVDEKELCDVDNVDAADAAVNVVSVDVGRGNVIF